MCVRAYVLWHHFYALHVCVVVAYVYFIHLRAFYTFTHMQRATHIFSLKVNEAEVDEMKLSLIQVPACSISLIYGSVICP